MAVFVSSFFFFFFSPYGLASLAVFSSGFLATQECLHLPMGDTGQVTISWSHFHRVSGGKHETVTRIIPFLLRLLNTRY